MCVLKHVDLAVTCCEAGTAGSSHQSPMCIMTGHVAKNVDSFKRSCGAHTHHVTHKHTHKLELSQTLAKHNFNPSFTDYLLRTHTQWCWAALLAYQMTLMWRVNDLEAQQHSTESPGNFLDPLKSSFAQQQDSVHACGCQCWETVTSGGNEVFAPWARESTEARVFRWETSFTCELVVYSICARQPRSKRTINMLA